MFRMYITISEIPVSQKSALRGIPPAALQGRLRRGPPGAVPAGDWENTFPRDKRDWGKQGVGAF